VMSVGWRTEVRFYSRGKCVCFRHHHPASMRPVTYTWCRGLECTEPCLQVLRTVTFSSDVQLQLREATVNAELACIAAVRSDSLQRVSALLMELSSQVVVFKKRDHCIIQESSESSTIIDLG
jgi:hypothetical protein